MTYARDPKSSGIRLIAITDGDEWIIHRMSGSRLKAETVSVSSDDLSDAAYRFADYLSRPKLIGPIAKKSRRSTKSTPRWRRRKWHPLTGELPEGVPTAVRLGKDAPFEWVSWRETYAEVAAYLVATGYIREPDLPVYVADGKYCAINDIAVHPGRDRKRFGKAELIGENMWLETYPSGKTLREYARRLLDDFHEDPGSVQVCFD